jgi:glycosyltransferase involved in cell wall biosynthesis
MLAHPSVRVLGHRDDVPTLLRDSDVFILPTIEEGSPLACLEALGSGCVPLVSDVCRGICRHGYNSLIHKVGDVDALAEQITLLDHDRAYLARLRSGALESRPGITWDAAGRSLLSVYRQLIKAPRSDHDDSPAYALSSRVSSGAM